MKTSRLAFDRSSVRRYDDDGRLHVEISNISKANVCPYLGSEIPGWQALALDPQKIYQLLRDPAELEKAAPTFNNLPLMLKHVHQKANDPQTDLIVGSIGDPSYEHPYLRASLCVWNEAGIKAIEEEVMVELSSSYHYDADMTPGDFEGTPYDGRMTNIRGNHLALVEDGRAGPDVVVSDANPFKPKQESPDMKRTKLGLALIAALGALSPKIAQDASLDAVLGKASKKTFKKDDAVAKLLAMDAEINPESLDEIIDAILGVEQNPEPETAPTAVADNDGAGEHAKIIDYLRSAGVDASVLEGVGAMLADMTKPAATDEGPDMTGYVKEDEVNTAMDGLRKEFRELETAKAAVRKTVGDVIGMDSAEQVYRFALTQLKVDHADMPAAGLGKLYAVASDRPTEQPKVSLAADRALVATVKGLDRFS